MTLPGVTFPVHRNTLPSGDFALSRDDAGLPIVMTRPEADAVAKLVRDPGHNVVTIEPVRFSRGFYVRVHLRRCVP